MQQPKILKDYGHEKLIQAVRATRQLAGMLGKLCIAKEYKWSYAVNDHYGYGIGLKKAKEFSERHLCGEAAATTAGALSVRIIEGESDSV